MVQAAAVELPVQSAFTGTNREEDSMRRTVLVGVESRVPHSLMNSNPKTCSGPYRHLAIRKCNHSGRLPPFIVADDLQLEIPGIREQLDVMLVGDYSWDSGGQSSLTLRPYGLPAGSLEPALFGDVLATYNFALLNMLLEIHRNGAHRYTVSRA